MSRPTLWDTAITYARYDDDGALGMILMHARQLEQALTHEDARRLLDEARHHPPQDVDHAKHAESGR